MASLSLVQAEREKTEKLFRKRLEILFNFFGDVASIIVKYEGAWPCIYCSFCGEIDLKPGSTFWISCSICHEYMYCCVQHKLDHWKTHKKICIKKS